MSEAVPVAPRDGIRAGAVTIGPAAGPAEWDAFLDRRPDATLFHRAAWLSIVERTFQYSPCSLVARRGDAVSGILPLYRVRLFPTGSAMVSSPMSVYGGVVADDEETRAALIGEARRMAEAARVDYLELRHLEPVEGLATGTRYVTFRREIDPDPDANMARIPRNQRRSIRVAQKHGLRGVFGGTELLDPFYDIYLESTRNLGSPVFPKALFAACFETLGKDCEILAIYLGERMVSGVMTFYYRDQVLPYYGGARRDAFHLACNDFMYWTLLEGAARRGLKVFDFGRSKRDSGSYHFKRHWGFEPKPLAYQYHLVRARSLPDLSPMNPKYALAIGAWKRMPLPLARRIGPLLVRYFP